MRPLLSRRSLRPINVEDEGHSDSERTSQFVTLLDGLVADLDGFEYYPSGIEDVVQQDADVDSSIYWNFPTLPAELRELIFQFCFEPFVVKLFCTDPPDVKDVLATADLPSTRTNSVTSGLVSGSLDDESPSKFVVVDRRPIRTVPLFHVCRQSRELAIRRYGVPDSQKLLFDSDIDSIRHCGGNPPIGKLGFWHVFGVHEKTVCDFKRVKTLQLHVSGYSTGGNFRLPPDCLFNNDVDDGPAPAQESQLPWLAIPSKTVINRFGSNLLQTIKWIDRYMPDLEELCFIVPQSSHKDMSPAAQSQILMDNKDRTVVDLSNIRTCMVAIGERLNRERKDAYLPRLHRLSIDSVT